MAQHWRRVLYTPTLTQEGPNRCRSAPITDPLFRGFGIPTTGRPGTLCAVWVHSRPEQVVLGEPIARVSSSIFWMSSDIFSVKTSRRALRYSALIETTHGDTVVGLCLFPSKEIWRSFIDNQDVILLTLRHMENLRTKDAISKYKQGLGGDACASTF